MSDFRLFINDPIGAEDFWDEPNGSDFLGLSDFPFLTQVHEFIKKNKDNTGFENLNLFVKQRSQGCLDTDDQLQVLAGGVSLLYEFISQNWVGPGFLISKRVLEIATFETRENALKQLVVDGENVISVVEVPELLLLSKVILESAWSNFQNLQAAKIWYLRSLFIHQQILEELSPELSEKMWNIIDSIKHELVDVPKNTEVLYYLEFARIFMYYQNVQKSRSEVTKATEGSGLEISLSGALGKRTKFQKRDLAQLILKVNFEDRENVNKETVKNNCCSQLKDIKLDDEVRLDKIKYTENGLNDYPDLTGLEQAVLLANLFQTQKSQPKDSLADEELQPLINCILDQAKVWSIRMTTLLLRSKLEANHKRTVERAMLQVQVLSDSLKDSGESLKQRFKYFFVSHLPPKWEVQSTLAGILTSMGSIKSALEVYESLKDWENVIGCYNVLQLRHKAQEIIEQELRKEPTPKLWCLLGDATDDVSCYEKAWELSNRRSARAQRHWAYFYYYRKNFAESIGHFQKSLEINSLQKDLWYRLGYAALAEEKWEISASAYRRYCVLDPECFESWNNLARCYCELNQKYRAWRALQEALKVDYSNWKVWDNYMLVSSDLRAFDEVIKSYHEVLNLKEKHLDIPILNCLVGGFRNAEEGEGNDTSKMEKSKFRSKLLELLGRLTSRTINDGELWFLYSEVVEADSPENTLKKHQLLMKAHRCNVSKPDWVKNLENCNRVIYVLSKAVEVGLLTRNPSVLMSCKLAATGSLVQIKKTHPDAGICEKLEKNLEEVEKILNTAVHA